MEKEQIRRIIYEELPAIMRQDKEVQRFILQLSREQFADKAETESRFDRIMDRLERDYQANQKLWEEYRQEQRRNEERWRKNEELWRENSERWEQQRRESEERWRKNDARWEQQQQESEERWRKNDARLDAMLAEIKRLGQKHDSTIGALGARWGVHSEASFRNALHGILTDSFDVKVVNVTEFDHEGEVFGRPDQVELDLIIHNGTLIIAEIKSSMSKGDMYTFERKVRFYEKRHQQQATRKVVISPMIDVRAQKVADELEIETFSYAGDVNL